MREAIELPLLVRCRGRCKKGPRSPLPRVKEEALREGEGEPAPPCWSSLAPLRRLPPPGDPPPVWRENVLILEAAQHQTL
uniref:Uncharacterized protein n=1 Tax=Setaria italica TaxID=4555 RepID=K4AHG9_SETIT